MGTSSQLSAQQAKALTDELAELSKQQSEALKTAPYIKMSKAEWAAYDRRRMRIQEISKLLAKFKPK